MTEGTILQLVMGIVSRVLIVGVYKPLKSLLIVSRRVLAHLITLHYQWAHRNKILDDDHLLEDPDAFFEDSGGLSDADSTSDSSDDNDFTNDGDRRFRPPQRINSYSSGGSFDLGSWCVAFTS